MGIHIVEVLNEQDLKEISYQLKNAHWQDGKISAGEQARKVKNNLQLDHNSPEAIHIKELILDRLNRNSDFFSIALPKKIFTPKVNCYNEQYCAYGLHVDNAMRLLNISGEYVRADLSCTIFLNSPESYQGGELSFEFGDAKFDYKLQAGQALIYPGGTLHEVKPVTKGVRYACFTWIESLVRSVSQREILYVLDRNLVGLRTAFGETDETTALTGVYHNLLREWSDS